MPDQLSPLIEWFNATIAGSALWSGLGLLAVGLVALYLLFLAARGAAMTRDEIVTAYCNARDLTRPDAMDFYQAMGLFRLAVIALQVHLRMAGGADKDGPFLTSALTLLDRAEEFAGV